MSEEVVHLLRKGLIQAEAGPVTDKVPPQALQNYVEDPRHRYSITVDGREHLEKKGGGASSMAAKKGVHLREIPPSPDETDSWLDRGDEALSRAQTLQGSRDPAASVSSSQKAIEVCLKALFPLVGLEVPKNHDASKHTTEITKRVSGDDEALEIAAKRIARLAVLNKISAPLHEVSEYGLSGVSERDLLGTDDSKVWRDYAYDAVSLAKEVRDLFKQGRLKPS